MKLFFCVIILCTIYSKVHTYYGYNYGLYGYPGCCCQSFWYCAVKGPNIIKTSTPSNCKDSGGYRCCVAEDNTLKCSLINPDDTTPKAQRYDLPAIRPKTVPRWEKIPTNCRDKGEYRCCVVSNVLKCKKWFDYPLTTKTSTPPVSPYVFNTTITLTVIKPPKNLVEASIVIDSDPGKSDQPAFKTKDESVIYTKPESERTTTLLSTKQHEIYLKEVPRISQFDSGIPETVTLLDVTPSTIETIRSTKHIEERVSPALEPIILSTSYIHLTHTEATKVVDTTISTVTHLYTSTLQSPQDPNISHIETTLLVPSNNDVSSEPSDINISTESSKISTTEAKKIQAEKSHIETTVMVPSDISSEQSDIILSTKPSQILTTAEKEIEIISETTQSSDTSSTAFPKVTHSDISSEPTEEYVVVESNIGGEYPDVGDTDEFSGSGDTGKNEYAFIPMYFKGSGLISDDEDLHF